MEMNLNGFEFFKYYYLFKKKNFIFIFFLRIFVNKILFILFKFILIFFLANFDAMAICFCYRGPKHVK